MGSKPSVGQPTIYAPPAPPTAANAAAVQASADARRKASEKQGIASTLLSDSKSGGDPTTILYGANLTKNSLLGGG